MDLGVRLRQAREARGKTLRDVAESTKISTGALEALEREDFGRLPGGIFARAFVRSVALEVGLDPEATLQEFTRRYPAAAREVPDEAGHEPHSSSPMRWVALAGGLTLLVVAVAFLWVSRSG